MNIGGPENSLIANESNRKYTRNQSLEIPEKTDVQHHLSNSIELFIDTNRFQNDSNANKQNGLISDDETKRKSTKILDRSIEKDLNNNSSISAGNSEIINGDLENIKDGLGRSINLKDNIYDKLLHRIDEHEPNLTQKKSEINPFHFKAKSVKKNKVPRSSINLTGRVDVPPNQLFSDSKEANFGLFSKSRLETKEIVFSHDHHPQQYTKKETFPSVFLSQNEMTINLGYKKTIDKTENFPRPVDNNYEEISRFFQEQYDNFSVGKTQSKKENRNLKKNKIKTSSKRRSTTLDPFVKLKVNKLENLFRVDFK